MSGERKSGKWPWWICSVCNHWNHPRDKQDVSLCEQCGHGRTDDDVPYDPANRGIKLPSAGA